MKAFILVVLSCFMLLVACVSPELKKLEEEQIIRDKNVQTVRGFFRLLEEEKIRDFTELYADNGKQITPYH